MPQWCRCAPRASLHFAVADSLEEAGDRLFTFTRFPPSQWKSIRTSNAIERLHEEFKRGSRPKPCCPAPKQPPCCSGRCSPPARSPGARSTDGRPSPRNHPTRSLTSPHDRIVPCRPKTRQQIPTQLATGPRIAAEQTSLYREPAMQRSRILRSRYSPLELRPPGCAAASVAPNTRVFCWGTIRGWITILNDAQPALSHRGVAIPHRIGVFHAAKFVENA